MNPPAGSSIHPDTGLFRWRPTAFQGGKTYLCQVVVCDDGIPSLCATQQVSINVADSLAGVTVSIGRTNLLAGRSGATPISVETAAALSKVAFQLDLPEASLLNLNLVPVSPNVLVASFQRASSNHYSVTVEARPGTSFEGTTRLVDLAFSTPGNATSASIALPPLLPLATPADGSAAIHALTRDGQIYLVGRAPLLEAKGLKDGTVSLTLFGRPKGTFRVESANRVDPQSWTPLQTLTLGATEEKRILAPIQPGTGSRFFRAVEANP